jgi:hypothetical protein
LTHFANCPNAINTSEGNIGHEITAREIATVAVEQLNGHTSGGGRYRKGMGGGFCGCVVCKVNF